MTNPPKSGTITQLCSKSNLLICKFSSFIDAKLRFHPRISKFLCAFFIFSFEEAFARSSSKWRRSCANYLKHWKMAQFSIDVSQFASKVNCLEWAGIVYFNGQCICGINKALMGTSSKALIGGTTSNHSFSLHSDDFYGWCNVFSAIHKELILEKWIIQLVQR